MNAKDFMMADQLRFGASGTGVERSLAELTDGFGLETHLLPYNVANAARVEAYVTKIRKTLGDDPSRPSVGVNRTVWRTMRGVHHGTIKWNAAKIREATSLVNVAGSLDVGAEKLHVHDVCGGKGVVGLYLAFLREKMGQATTGTCWELQAGRQEGHEWIRSWLQLNARIDFQSADVLQADLTRKSEGKTHVLAKHACGPLTDAVFANVDAIPDEKKPDVTAVMTCCHSYLQGNEAFWPASMTPEQRLQLSRSADPHKDKDPYNRDVVGVVARRVIDSLRAIAIGGHVHEALPFGRECNRNHVIVEAKA